MGSIAAKNVATEVLETIGRGQRPNISKIAVKKGYSPNTAKAGLVQKTKSYKEITQPVVQRWEKERERITQELEQRDLTEVQYKDLAKVLDTLTQNIQLLSGGSTANVAAQLLVRFIDGNSN